MHFPPAATSLSGHSLIVRTGTLKSESSVGSEEELLKNGARESTGAPKNEYVVKADSHDSLFIEDVRYPIWLANVSVLKVKQVIVAIANHFGENLVRVRVQEYGGHFVRLAARYEEEVKGQTTIGYPSSTFSGSKLGSGFILGDDVTIQRELLASANRVEAFQKTNTYQYLQAVSLFR